MARTGLRKDLTTRLTLFVLMALSAVAQSDETCPGGSLAFTTYYGQFGRIEAMCQEITHQGMSPETGEVFADTYRYVLTDRKAVPFLRLVGHDEEEHWLALRGGDLLFLYDGEGEPPLFFGVTGSKRRLQALHYFPEAFSASSFLTEGDTEYSPDNLDWHWTRKPWVEGVPGQGIGEEIYIDRWFGRLWISIGFVSYDRPELYELNSRPKTIRVVSEATGEERVVELEDTPNLQPIDVPGDWETASDGGIRIIIEEVFPGSRWEDTAINFIVFF
jgi:hypothetical protein